ncbi:hypothetical protein [Spirosoma pomorum]
MKQFLVLVFGLYLLATISQGQDLIDLAKRIPVPRDRIAPKDLASYYFPLVLSPDSSVYVGLDPFMNRRYSEVLAILNEPVLYRNHSDTVIYRLTWLRAFHPPVVIRLEEYKGTSWLVWKVHDKTSSPQLITNRKKLDQKTYNTFTQKVSRAAFWQLSTNEDVLGLDGSSWILEGKLPDRYHVVDRFMPKVNSTYYQCCNFLIELTGLQFSDREKH